MPDRSINLFSKSDAAAWASTPSAKGNALQIISGSLSNLKTGEIMQAVLQRTGSGAASKGVGNGTFKIILNGETFLIKGLPAAMLGKEINLIAQKSGSAAGAKTELLWLANTALGNKKTATGQHNISRSSLSKHAEILSALPAGLKTGQSITGRIDAVQGKQMRISSMVQDGAKTVNIQILTSSIKGMKAGDAIAGNIVSAANGKTMLEIIPQQRANPANTGKVMANFKMAVGDTATAFVQQRLANGQVQLNIQGTTVETAAPANINKGDALVLKMTKQPAGFQLLSVHKNAASTALNSFKTNLPINNPPIAQNIAAMRLMLPGLIDTIATASNALPPLDSALKANEISPQQPLNGERLAQMIRDGGAGLESKLLQLSQNPTLSPSLQQDLKAIMLQLANLQGGNSQQHDLINTLRELGQQSVSRIETGQALNILTSLQGEPMRLELPMLVNQQMVNVQLSIQQQSGYESDSSQQSEASDDSYHVLFALELSQLGAIRVDANISDSSLHARIYNDNAASNQFIQDNIGRLESRLQGLGFKEVYLISSQQQPDTEKQQRFEQLTQMMPSSASLSLVDIRI